MFQNNSDINWFSCNIFSNSCKMLFYFIETDSKEDLLLATDLSK